MIELDLSGLKCPLPALKTRKALLNMQAGLMLVKTTDPMAQIDIPHLVNTLEMKLVSMNVVENGHHFTIEKNIS